MGFFSQFDVWLNVLLLTYVGDNTARLAATLEPAIVTLGVIYVMIWGYLQLTGQIEEPFVAGIKRIALLVIVFGVSLRLWLYNPIVVDTFFHAPARLAAIIVGASDAVGTTDAIMNAGTGSAELLIRKGGILSGNFSFYVAGVIVYAIVGMTTIYTMFLLALSRIALSVLLALGPFFFALLLFDSTKRFFESWLAQLCNYAFITILTVLVAALMLHVVGTAAQHAVSLGGGIQIADGARVCVAAGLTFLVMRQVMPMAAGLASGLALSTFGVTSAAVGWALGSAYRKSTRGLGEFGRGLTDTTTSRWDSWSRKAGYYSRRGVSRLLARPNQIRARS
jgi:type IV secretion system protein VirB6